jgi:transcriptional regulator with XRE-family HTH domain
VSENFGERLTRICREREISQVKLGKLVKVTNRAVSGWMRSEYYPKYWELFELSVKLNLSLDYLCCITDEPRTC